MSDDPIRRPPTLVLVLVVPVIALLAIGLTQVFASDDGATAAVPAAGGNAIVIKNFAFAPPTITAKPGAKIVVTNGDSTTHTVTASDKSFDTGNLSGGAKKTITAPTKAGTYSYICDIHQYMQGTLKVQG